ncbi:MAG: class I SAM-dependent methyltransferase family protein [Chloroflexi bacterium]|nr:class I SAM-dependent methyltransferase family protein [Chloroflexota bacterium]
MAKKLKWRATSLAMSTIGRTSDGINLGYRYGFDSGEMLDYVYENRARGALLVGRLLDRIYLNAVGWRGIRARKGLLKAVLRGELQARLDAGKKTVLLDVASGPARYLIETLQELKAGNEDASKITIVCRDLDAKGLEWGKERASEAGLTNIRFELGDACDPASLAKVRPRPDIVVVSGLYELFADVAPIRCSMAGIFAILQPGGKLFFTTQVNHPQLEMIANVLTNRQGKPWVMDCRSIETVEALAREAGFKVIGSQMEPVGLFALTTAEKPKG